MSNFLKKILFFVIIFSFFTFIPIFIFNYTFDPYGFFGDFSDNYKSEPNMRSLKNWYILENNLKHKNLFFSNSRGGTFIFSDPTYYNMSYSMGGPHQFYEDIVDLINNGVDIKSVIIMIDEYTIFNNPDIHIRLPLTIKFNRNEYFKLLNIPLSRTKISSILSFNKQDKHLQFNINSDGSYSYNNFTIDDQIDTLRTEILTLPPSHKTQQAFYDIEKCVTYLRSKFIDVSIGVHPISNTNYVNNIYYFEQLKSLINMLDNSDIDLFNELVIIDDKNLNSIFYDASHYSPTLAKQVINNLNYSVNNPKP